MLRLLIDESTGRSVVDFLASSGHDAVYVPDVMPQANDSTILNMAAREGRIVVTNDKDFGELTFKSGIANAGIILLRLDDESAGNRVRMMALLMEKHADLLSGAFTVVTEKAIRIRRSLTS